MRRHNGADSGVKTPAQGDRETDWWAEELFYTKLPNHENNLNLNWIENYRNSQTKNNGFHYWQQRGQQQSIIIFFFPIFWLLKLTFSDSDSGKLSPAPSLQLPLLPPGLQQMHQLLQSSPFSGLAPSQLQQLVQQGADAGRKQLEQLVPQLQEQLQVNFVQQTHLLQVRAGDETFLRKPRPSLSLTLTCSRLTGPSPRLLFTNCSCSSNNSSHNYNSCSSACWWWVWCALSKARQSKYFWCFH